MPLVNYDVKSSDGERGTLSDRDVVEQLSGMGYQVLGPSTDGQTITVQDANGQFSIPITQALEKIGYQVDSMNAVAESAGFDTVSGELRAGVAKLPSDSMRKQYLEQTLQNKGIVNAQVMGQGRDWYFFDQQAGQYKALTNTPGWDRFDALEGAVELPRLAGAGIGGTLGAMGGSAIGGALDFGATRQPGAVAGGGAGAGLGFLAGTAGGSALADIGTRYVMSAISPEFKQVAEENMGQMGRDVAINAGIDTLGGGLAKYAPAAVGSVFPGFKNAVSNVMNKGIVSPTVKTAGEAAEKVGAGVEWAAGKLQNPLGRSVGTMTMPVVGEAETAGVIAGLPAQGLRGLPGTMQKLGSKPWMQEYLPGPAEWLRRSGQNLRRATNAVNPSTMSEQVAKTMAMPGTAQTAKGAQAPAVARVLGERAARGTGRNIQRVKQAFTGAEEYVPNPVSQATVKAVGRGSEAVGRGLEAVEQFGQGVSQTARGISGLGIGATQAVGAGVRRGGQALRTAGTLASPLESRFAMQQGGDYLKDEGVKELERLQRQRMQANINSILAGN